MSEDLKRCSKCEMTYSKSIFYKDISTKDGLNPICRRGYCTKNFEKLIEHRKEDKRNRAKRNKYEKNEKDRFEI